MNWHKSAWECPIFIGEIWRMDNLTWKIWFIASKSMEIGNWLVQHQECAWAARCNRVIVPQPWSIKNGGIWTSFWILDGFSGNHDFSHGFLKMFNQFWDYEFPVGPGCTKKLGCPHHESNGIHVKTRLPLSQKNAAVLLTHNYDIWPQLMSCDTSRL